MKRNIREIPEYNPVLLHMNLVVNVDQSTNALSHTLTLDDNDKQVLIDYLAEYNPQRQLLLHITMDGTEQIVKPIADINRIGSSEITFKVYHNGLSRFFVLQNVALIASGRIKSSFIYNLDYYVLNKLQTPSATTLDIKDMTQNNVLEHNWGGVQRTFRLDGLLVSVAPKKGGQHETQYQPEPSAVSWERFLEFCIKFRPSISRRSIFMRPKYTNNFVRWYRNLITEFPDFGSFKSNANFSDPNNNWNGLYRRRQDLFTTYKSCKRNCQQSFVGLDIAARKEVVAA